MSEPPFDPDEFAGTDSAYDPERLQFIGQVVTDWNICEMVMQIIVWGLTGIDHELGECITADLSNPNLITLAKNSLNRFHKNELYFQRFLTVFDFFDECRQARNIIAHSTIISDRDEFISLSSSMKSGRGVLRLTLGIQTNEELDVIAAAIGELIYQLNDCCKTLDDEPVPSRDKDLLPLYMELLRELRLGRKRHDYPR